MRRGNEILNINGEKREYGYARDFKVRNKQIPSSVSCYFLEPLTFDHQITNSSSSHTFLNCRLFQQTKPFRKLICINWYSWRNDSQKFCKSVSVHCTVDILKNKYDISWFNSKDNLTSTDLNQSIDSNISRQWFKVGELEIGNCGIMQKTYYLVGKNYVGNHFRRN